eukprot:835202-Heterocapsa_arctica.AAC.1
MTSQMFWNMVLHTRSKKDKAHSYMVKYWPSMRIVFIKAVRTEWQIDVQKRKREQQEEQAGRWKRDQAWGSKTAERYQEQPSSSGAGWQDRSWSSQQWEDAGSW